MGIEEIVDRLYAPALRSRALGRLVGRSTILLAYLVLLVLGLFGLVFFFLNYPWLAIGLALLLLLLLAIGNAERQRGRTRTEREERRRSLP